MKTWENMFEEKEIAQIRANCESLYESAFQDNIVYPERNNIYKAFDLTPFSEVKVVLLGQDPYHGHGQANGLAFSVNEGVKLPPSLKNIFAELQNDIGGPLQCSGDLTEWAKQGVLLLNTSLTVVEGKPNSMPFWSELTDKIIQYLDTNVTPVVFILWGSNAQKKKQFIVNNKEYVIESVHPSPLSAYRGFFGSKPFSKTNKILIENNIKPIDWI